MTLRIEIIYYEYVANFELNHVNKLQRSQVDLSVSEELPMMRFYN